MHYQPLVVPLRKHSMRPVSNLLADSRAIYFIILDMGYRKSRMSILRDKSMIVSVLNPHRRPQRGYANRAFQEEKLVSAVWVLVREYSEMSGSRVEGSQWFEQSTGRSSSIEGQREEDVQRIQTVEIEPGQVQQKLRG